MFIGKIRRAESPPSLSASKQIVALDAIRALAALTVFFAHARGAFFTPWNELPPEHQTLFAVPFYAIARFAHEAVLIFFVLSGYFVGGQILKRMEQGRFSVRDYAIDRTTRLLLPLIPACLFAGAVGYFLFGYGEGAGTILGNMVGLNDVTVETLKYNQPLWSIAYEMWFYILAGAAACLFLGRSALAAFGVVLVSTAVFGVLEAAFILFWVMGALMAKIENDCRRAVCSWPG